MPPPAPRGASRQRPAAASSRTRRLFRSVRLHADRRWSGSSRALRKTRNQRLYARLDRASITGARQRPSPFATEPLSREPICASPAAVSALHDCGRALATHRRHRVCSSASRGRRAVDRHSNTALARSRASVTPPHERLPLTAPTDRRSPGDRTIRPLSGGFRRYRHRFRDVFTLDVRSPGRGVREILRAAADRCSPSACCPSG